MTAFARVRHQRTNFDLFRRRVIDDGRDRHAPAAEHPGTPPAPQQARMNAAQSLRVTTHIVFLKKAIACSNAEPLSKCFVTHYPHKRVREFIHITWRNQDPRNLWLDNLAMCTDRCGDHRQSVRAGLRVQAIAKPSP